MADEKVADQHFPDPAAAFDKALRLHDRNRFRLPLVAEVFFPHGLLGH